MRRSQSLTANIRLIVVALLVLSPEETTAQSLPRLVDVSTQAGLFTNHGYQAGLTTDPRKSASGVAAGDYDLDGFVDLYVISGDIGSNALYRNLGDGTFERIETAGVNIPGSPGSGPTFSDYDGDGLPDLFVGGLESTPLRMFKNLGGGNFVDTTQSCGITGVGNTFSAAFGDYDRDGDLDLFLTHWSGRQDPRQSIHLWQNQGDGTFQGLEDSTVGLTGYETNDYSFTPNFSDINSDGWPDLLVAGDFRSSMIFINQKDGTFENTTTSVISDDNGMGAAVGDYDNDGDLDWFVSSIWDPEPGFGFSREGNRLYRNLGDGTFEDVTLAAGVRDGYWGWGSCFADFNNDGNLDLFHTNGFIPQVTVDDPRLEAIGAAFHDDPSRLFISNGDGTFTESSEEWGLEDRAQGRGVVCFDYDRDGDVDLFVNNNDEPSKLFRNEGGNTLNYLSIGISRKSARAPAAGTRVYVRTGSRVQLQELRVGSNYVSQQPQELHFGLGRARQADEVRVVWPDGQEQAYFQVSANQHFTLGRTATQPRTVPFRILLPHAPLGASIAATMTLINTNPNQSSGGVLEFFDQVGQPRTVILEGWGTASSFTFGSDFLAPGGSRTLRAPSEQALSLGSATFSSDVSIDVQYRFEFGDTHIAVPPSRLYETATVPVLTARGFDTGLAVSNAGAEPLFLTVSLIGATGAIEETLQPPSFNPLPAFGQSALFLTELGFQGIADRDEGTIQLSATEGMRFGALALVSGRGTLSTAPVLGRNSSEPLPIDLVGVYSGSWRTASSGEDFDAGLLISSVESAGRVVLQLQLDGGPIDDDGPLEVILLGRVEGRELTASGETAGFGRLDLVIARDGNLQISSQPGANSTFRITGTAFAEGVEAEWEIKRAGDSTRRGTIRFQRATP